MFDGECELAPGRFRRSLQTITFRVVEPAMIGACDPPFFDSAVGKRSAPVRAAVLQKAQLSLLAFKQHQVFTKNPHELHRIVLGNIRCDGDRVPVASQQFSSRRPGPDPCERFVFFRGQHFTLLFNSDFSALMPCSNPQSSNLSYFVPAKISSINLTAGLIFLVSGSSMSKYFMPSRRRSVVGICSLGTSKRREFLGSPGVLISFCNVV